MVFTAFLLEIVKLYQTVKLMANKGYFMRSKTKLPER